MILVRYLIVWLYLLLAACCLLPAVSATQALCAGIAFSLILGNPFARQAGQLATKLLAASIVGLGAGMNLVDVFRLGADGLVYTLAGITTTFLAGSLLANWFSISRQIASLICVGTAICGGSAIAAAAPVLRARADEISIALAVVFVLNAFALILFPLIGHTLELSQYQFGMWCALAIHDTSSVVGAALVYGTEALDTATTVKLTRALWIIPVCLCLTVAMHYTDRPLLAGKPAEGIPPSVSFSKFKVPWFIFGFLVVSGLVTFFPVLEDIGIIAEELSRRSLVLTLYLIGSGLTLRRIKDVGIRSLSFAAILWLFVALLTLTVIYLGWI